MFRIFKSGKETGSAYFMVNPKKDYELLMRYLQGGEPKRREAAIPEPTYPDTWGQPPESSNNSNIPEPYPAKKATPVPAHHKNWHLSLPRFKKFSLSTRFRIFIAAIALIILVVGFWNAFSVYKLSPDSLYKKLYVPFTVTVANDKQPAEKNSIADYYRTGNYVAVTMQGKKQPRLTDKENLLTGLAYLHRDDYTAAIKRLEPLSNNFHSPYRQQAEYYLALAYLKNEDYDRCIVKMEQIAYTPSHPYHSLITKGIIKDIKMLKWK